MNSNQQKTSKYVPAKKSNQPTPLTREVELLRDEVLALREQVNKLSKAFISYKKENCVSGSKEAQYLSNNPKKTSPPPNDASTETNRIDTSKTSSYVSARKLKSKEAQYLSNNPKKTSPPPNDASTETNRIDTSKTSSYVSARKLKSKEALNSSNNPKKTSPPPNDASTETNRIDTSKTSSYVSARKLKSKEALNSSNNPKKTSPPPNDASTETNRIDTSKTSSYVSARKLKSNSTVSSSSQKSPSVSSHFPSPEKTESRQYDLKNTSTVQLSEGRRQPDQKEENQEEKPRRDKEQDIKIERQRKRDGNRNKEYKKLNSLILMRTRSSGSSISEIWGKYSNFIQEEESNNGSFCGSHFGIIGDDDDNFEILDFSEDVRELRAHIFRIISSGQRRGVEGSGALKLRESILNWLEGDINIDKKIIQKDEEDK